MWHLPRSRTELASPALAGDSLPLRPGKPLIYFFDVKLFVDLFIQQMCTRHYFEPVVRLWIQAWNNIKSVSSNAYCWVREGNSRLKDKVIHNIISDIINASIWEAAYQELTYPKSSSTPHNNSWGRFIVPILFWEDRFRLEGTLSHVVLGRVRPNLPGLMISRQLDRFVWPPPESTYICLSWKMFSQAGPLWGLRALLAYKILLAINHGQPPKSYHLQHLDLLLKHFLCI